MFGELMKIAPEATKAGLNSLFLGCVYFHNYVVVCAAAHYLQTRSQVSALFGQFFYRDGNEKCLGCWRPRGSARGSQGGLSC